jgi:glycosyltransferase involved in cell wall biosynthesis
MAEPAEPSGLRAGSEPPISITVFFPCYNEQENVAKVTRQALQVLAGLEADYEIVIVNDGSSDHTGAVADQLAREHERVRVIHHPRNLGYGAALQSGFRGAAKELVFFTDGDGQFDLTELPPLLPLAREYDIVCGYRMNRQDNLVRRMNGRLWTKLSNMMFSLHLRDIDCAFKLYRRAIFDDIRMESTGALISTEILARAVRKGYTITERGVHHYPRTAGKQTGGNLKVIWRAFRELWKLRRRILTEP